MLHCWKLGRVFSGSPLLLLCDELGAQFYGKLEGRLGQHVVIKLGSKRWRSVGKNSGGHPDLAIFQLVERNIDTEVMKQNLSGSPRYRHGGVQFYHLSARALIQLPEYQLKIPDARFETYVVRVQ